MVDIQIKQRTFLSHKAIKEIASELEGKYGKAIQELLHRNVAIEEGDLSNDGKVLIIEKQVSFFKPPGKGKQWIPFRDIAERFDIPQIVIDQPAVPYIADGADVMRPGIVEIDERIKEGDLVAIVDEKNRITLAIGKSKFDATAMEAMDKGKVIKNIHHAGDRYWNLRSQV
ncbi:hypothetical protein GF325_12375 [Candidatus Bathyarchaeota archaeon]|nr:hypothetical protein [Candidatus Bathyarchaeota archaeon]